jgi:hypothetical protein
MAITTTTRRHEQQLLGHLEGPTVRRTEARRPHHRPSLMPIFLAAVLALTAVAVADRVEQNLVLTNDVDANTTAAPADATPLTSAALPAGQMVLTLTAQGAAISTGSNDAIFELGTDTIGDLDLTGVEPIITQTDGEVSADFGDVTEWFRTDGDGIEHGYTLDAPVAAGDQLTVTVDVTDATPTLVDNQTVAIARTDGSTVWYRGLFAFDANGTDLPAEMAVVDGDIELRVDTAGAAYPLTIDPTITSQVIVPVSGGPQRFGSALDVDGNRMAVAAPFAEVAGVPGAGLVRLYERADASSPWVLESTIESPSPQVNGGFGDSLDLRAGWLAIGESYAFDPAIQTDGRNGRAWVFDPIPSNVGGAVELGGAASADRFGKSLVWLEAGEALAIGAPGVSSDAGAVVSAIYDGSSWTLQTLTPSTTQGPLLAGHKLGYAMAYAQNLLGGALVVGAPGASRSYQWIYDTDVNTFRNPIAVQYDIAWNLGSAVDFSTDEGANGSRVAIGGISDELRVAVTEVVSQRTNTTSLGAVLLAGADAAPFNDYLDLDGSTLAISRYNVGVERYTVNDTTLLLSDVTVYKPAAVLQGDRLGWAIDLAGGALVAGAPGDSGLTGAVYTSLPVVATFTGAANNSWGNDANWDTLVVPGPYDIAVVPAGAAVISADQAVDALVVSAGATVTVGSGASFTITDQGGPTGTDSVLDGTLAIETGSTVSIATTAELLINGSINNQPGGLLRFIGTADQSINGAGTIQNEGTIDAANLNNQIFLNTTVTSAADSELVGSGYNLVFTRDYVEQGSVVVELNGSINFFGAFTAADPSVVVEFEVSAGKPYAIIDFSGALNFNGATVRTTLLDGFAPTGPLPYPTFFCDDCASANINFDGPLSAEIITDFNGAKDGVLFGRPEAGLSLEFEFAAADSAPEKIATSIAVGLLDRISVEGSAAGSTLAAASLEDIAGDNPQSTALSSIPIGATPLTSIVIDSDVLSAIPLVNIGIDGGWGQIIAGSELENEPLASLTFGQVLRAAGEGSDASVPETDSPAGRLASTPLTSIEVEGTPLTSIPLSAIALGETPLTSIPLTSIGQNWCDIIADLFPDRDSCEAALGELTLLEVTLRGVPLTSIPLTSIPLTSIDLAQSPLTSIPLTSIDLAKSPLTSIPLTSIPLTSIPLTSIDPASAPLTSIPLTSIGPAALPLTSIPLTSIPLTSIELSDTPLTSIPLTSIGPDGTPLTSIQVRQGWCDFLAETEFNCENGADPSTTTFGDLSVQGVPLTSIPLTSIPLTSIPLTSIPLTSITTSIPLTSIPLTSIGPDGTPLTSIQLRGAPLTSIPLTSIVLANTPLTSIPLTSIAPGEDPPTVDEISAQWCVVLLEADAGFDCTSGADPATTKLRDLSVRGVPLTSIPLTSIPLTSIDIVGSPLTSIPLTSIPLTSIPLTSIPLTSIPLTSIGPDGTPLTSIPLTSIPLTSINLVGTPLTSIPLTSIPLTSIPLTSIPLTSIPLTSIPLTSIPLTSIDIAGSPLTSIPLTSIDIAGSPLTSIPLTSIPLTSIPLTSIVNCDAVDCQQDTLGDAERAGAILDSATLGDIQQATSGIRLGEIVDALSTVTRVDLIAALDGANLTMADLEGLDDLTLGDLPLDLPALAGLTLGQLGEALNTVTFGDLVGAIVDPATGEPFNNLEADFRAGIEDSGSSTLGDLDTLGDLTLGDLLEGFQGPITLLDIEPILGFITVQTLANALGITLDIGSGTLGDLTPEQLGQLTLGDILSQAGGTALGDLLDGLESELANYSLGDLLLALVDPGSLALGGIKFTDVSAAALPAGTSPSSTFDATFTLRGESKRDVTLTFDIPTGASYLPETATIQETPAGAGAEPATGVEPEVQGQTLTWMVTAEPDVRYDIQFNAVLGLRLGATGLTGTARVVGTDIVEAEATIVTIEEGSENNDYPEVVEAEEGFVYLTYIADETDIDVYKVVVQENDRLFVELSNLDADLDLVLYSDVNNGETNPLAPTSSEAPLVTISDPDSDGADTEPLDDFVRLDQTHPNLKLIEVSNQAGTTSEGLATGRLPAGDYYIQVHGANGAVNLRPAALQLQIAESEDAPECRSLGLQDQSVEPGSSPSIGTDINTLILVNESRLEQLYGSAARANVAAALARLTTSLANDRSITPAVVAVDGNDIVQAAFVAWDTDTTCNPDSANDVVRAINTNIINEYRDQLEHVMILGGDEIIPMARLSDSTEVANEYDFRNEFDGDLAGPEAVGRNALTSTFWASRILSDEPYGESDARSLGNRYLYVSDIALGRLVETPADIVQALDTFVEYNGSLAIDTATVLGYDFLVDGSEQVAAKLAEGLGSDAVDDELADGLTDAGAPWDRDDAAAKLTAAGTNALISLNAHFDHYRALPAIGDKVPGFEDNLIAADVAEQLGDRALANSLIFSMGCHSGLSVSDISITGTNTDWPETFAQQDALFIGNTGFGYGDTESVAYTELLMALFAAQVTGPFDLDPSDPDTSSTVGQALTWAKNEYVGGLQTFSVYDEKAVMESTFYGIPFYRVGLDTKQLPMTPTNGLAADNETLDGGVQVEAENVENRTPTGTYYANADADGNELVIVAPGRPIQPKEIIDVTIVDVDDRRELAAYARGAIIESMASIYVTSVDPVIATPVFDESNSQPEPDVGDSVFPARPLDITTTEGPSGTRQQLVIATGQFNSDGNVQRLDKTHDITVYYSDSTDFDPPTIGVVSSAVVDGQLTIETTADDASEVTRVVALIAQDPGRGEATWQRIELVNNGSTWSNASTPFELLEQTVDIEFIVQVLDGAGNVGFANDKANGFADSTIRETNPPTGADDLSVTVEPVEPQREGAQLGFYAGAVKITVAGSSESIRYSVDGEPLASLTDGSFTVSGAGPHNWVVKSLEQTITGGFTIDTDSEPEVKFRTPINDASFNSGTTARFDVDCVDQTSDQCVLVLTALLTDNDPIGLARRVQNNGPLPTVPGSYRLSVTATDRVGNRSTATSEFTITSTPGAPQITDLVGPLTPQEISTPVVIDATFVDPSGTSDDYVLEVDWGDETDPEVIPVQSADEPTATTAASVSATHTYEENGVYIVQVTVRDDSGGAAGRPDSDTATVSEFVVVYDPTIRGRVSGAGFYWSGAEAHSGSPSGESPAFFGYRARNKKGADVPTGSTMLRLVGEFFFRSTSYDYLIVNDTLAIAEGIGTTGGSSEYRFRVQGIDNGWVDYFQLSIWDDATGDVLYDNGVMYSDGELVDTDTGDRVLRGGIRVRS